MAFPTTGVLDNFNRANSSTLGANWSASVFGNSNLGVNGNQCRPGGSAYHGNRWNVATYGPDSEVYVTVATEAGGLELLARIANPGSSTTDGYSVFGNDPADSWSINRYDNGGFTQLGASISRTIASGDGVGFEVVGSTLTMYYKAGAGSWSSVASRSDSTYTAAGSLAIEASVLTARLDDFGGGTVVGGAFEINAAPGSFSVTGAASGVVSGRVVSANPGSYAITGAATGLVKGFVFSADPGSFAITGMDASFLVDRVLSASPGSYAITGDAAGLIADRILSATPGSYVITGIDATFEYVPGASSFELIADPGSFVVTGIDTGVLADRVISADPGAFTITGEVAAALAARLFSVNPGSFTITGIDAAPVVGRVISADPASFVITGDVAGLVPPSASSNNGPSRRVIHIRFGVYP